MAKGTKNLLSNLTRTRDNDVKIDAVLVEENKPIVLDEPKEITKEKQPIIIEKAKATSTPIIKNAQKNLKLKPELVTVKILKEEWKYIQDLVVHKKMQGYTDYTQQEAYSEAFSYLMEKYPKSKFLRKKQD